MRKVYLLIILFTLIANNKLFSQCAVTISPLSNNGTTTTELDCVNTSITLTADTSGTQGNATFSWNNGPATQAITVDNPGTYAVTITDNACIASSSITITSFNVSALAFPATICNGDSSTLVGLGADTYTWEPGTLSGTVVNVGPDGNLFPTTTYTVTGVNSNGCSAENTVAVTVNLLPLIYLTGGSQTICGNDQGDPIQVESDNNNITYQWFINTQPNYSNATILSGETGTSVVPAPGIVGTYYYFCVGTTSCGTDTSDVSGAIVVTSPIQIVGQPSSNSETLCVGEISTIILVAAVGTNPIRYDWFSNTIQSNTDLTNAILLLQDTQANFYFPDNSTAGTLYYFCVARGFCGAEDTSDVTGPVTFITNTNIINQTLSLSSAVCSGEDITFSVEAEGEALSYQWFSNTISSTANATLLTDSTSASIHPNTQTAGTLYYFCVVSGTCGTLTSSISDAVVVRETISITAQPSLTAQIICTSEFALPTTNAIFVTATGSNPTYQWYSNTTADNTNGSPISGATSASYIPASTDATTIYYYCIVSYDDGVCPLATSNVSGPVTFIQSTEINTQPSTNIQNVCLNSTATAISISANGAGTLQYQWYSNTINSYANSTLLTGSTSSSIIPDTQTAGTLFYFCIVSGACGADTSDLSGAVNVSQPFSISNQPSSNGQSLCPGDPATTLFITANGSNPTYQWYSNTIPNNTTGTPITGASASSYTPDTQNAGTNYYYCVVSNNGGCSSVSSDVSGAIIVAAAPNITTQPSNVNQTVCLNSAATGLTVIATGSNLSYQWYSNITSSYTNATMLTDSIASSIIPNTQTGGTLFYFCIVSGNSNCYAPVASNISGAVTVNEPISITGQPNTNLQSICLHDAATALSITANGAGPLYQWYSNLLPDNTGGSAIAGATAASFIPDTQTAGTLYYYCIVSTTTGCSLPVSSAVSGTITINPLPTGNISGATTVCQNAAHSITFTGTAGSAPFTFFFNVNGAPPALTITTTGTSTSVLYPVSTGSIGTFNYILDSIRDANGCHQQQSGAALVEIITTPTLTSTRSLSICDSTLLDYTATSNSPGAVITWERAAVPGISNPAAPGANPNPIVETLNNITSQPVLVKYMLTITNGTCIALDSILVTVNPTPVIDHINDTSFCNGTPVSGFIFSSASPNTTFKWYCSQTVGFGSSGNGNISSFFATNTGNIPITDTVVVLIDTSNNHCFGDSIRFVITVNPSPPSPDFNFLGEGGFTLICEGSENINFNITFPAEPGDSVSYLWNTIPLNAPGVVIHDLNDANTTISFYNYGIDTIQAFSVNPQSIGGCRDSVKHVVGVNHSTTGGPAIKTRKILKKQPGNLLIYPDNKVHSYQWGYDVLIRSTPDTAYGEPVNVDGQVYQFFIPPDMFIINNELDTINYAYWVLLDDGGCYSRVYYNGPYAARRMQSVPQDDYAVQLNLFPNPNKGIFDIVLKGDIYGSMDAKIYNAMGQVVFTNTFNKTIAEVHKKIDAGYLSGGVYYLVIRGSDLKKVVTHFIVQQ